MKRMVVQGQGERKGRRASVRLLLKEPERKAPTKRERTPGPRRERRLSRPLSPRLKEPTANETEEGCQEAMHSTSPETVIAASNCPPSAKPSVAQSRRHAKRQGGHGHAAQPMLSRFKVETGVEHALDL